MTDILAKLTEKGLLAPDAAELVRKACAEGTPLDEALLSADGSPDEGLLRFLAAEFRVPYVDVENRRPSRDFLVRFPARILLEHQLLPLEEQEDGAVLVATSRLFDTTGLDELRLISGSECRPALAAAPEIERCLKQCLGVGADTVQSLVLDAEGTIQVLDHESDTEVDLTLAAEDASIIRFVNEVLMLVLLVFVGGQVFLCVAGCQVPDSAAPASHSVLDPCAERLHEIAGRLLLYYSVNKRLPASSDELNSMAGDGSALPLICPASGEAYLYRSQGLSVPGQPGKLVLYDATAAHHDGRWGIVVSDNAPGSSLITRVVWIDEAVMRSVPGAAEPLEKADTEKLD